MEMYKIIATCLNDSSTHTFVYTPENFEGIKITREFSFVPPYGFTPKFATETMRAIRDDATYVASKNAAFGYFLEMHLEVSKLNADGVTYSFLTNLIVNPKTITVNEGYVEFSVDVLNSAVDYFNKKATKRNLLLTTLKNVAGDYYKINNVSLNSTDFEFSTTNVKPIPFQKSESVNIIHDSDLSLYDVLSYNSEFVIYQCVTGGDLNIYFALDFSIGASTPILTTPTGGVAMQLVVLNGSNGATSTIIWGQSVNITKNLQILNFTADLTDMITLNPNDFIILRIAKSGLDPETTLNLSRQNAAVTIKKTTAIKYNKKALKTLSVSDIFTNLFGTINFTPNADTFITSDKYIMSNIDELGIIPQDFVREISTMAGLVFNFKDDTTKIEYLNDYFIRIAANDRIVIDKYTDLKISNYEQVYSSFTVGVEKFETENNVYYFPFQKKLTFEQTKQEGDSIEMVCTRLSADTEKIINRMNDAAVGNNQTSNDNYYLVPLRAVPSNENIPVSDFTTPREMIKKHNAILSLFFGNFGQTTAPIADNDGVSEALFVFGASQHDSLIYSDTQHLCPIVYEFNALLGDADFSEQMVQMTDFNGNVVNLFVYSAETTDKISEIKCKALVYS